MTRMWSPLPRTCGMSTSALLLGGCLGPLEAPPPYYADPPASVDAGSPGADSDDGDEPPDSPDADGSASPDGNAAPDGDGAAPDGSAAPAGSDASVAAPDCLTPLVAGMKKRINTCRACHQANGIAGGSRFVLDQDGSADATNLQAAYAALGRDLLLIPAQEEGRKHESGRWIQPGSQTYAAWATLMEALAEPGQACAAGAL